MIKWTRLTLYLIKEWTFIFLKYRILKKKFLEHWVNVYKPWSGSQTFCIHCWHYTCRMTAKFMHKPKHPFAVTATVYCWKDLPHVSSSVPWSLAWLYPGLPSPAFHPVWVVSPTLPQMATDTLLLALWEQGQIINIYKYPSYHWWW